MDFLSVQKHSKMEEIVSTLIIKNGMFLAVKEDKDWYWKTPGGKIEPAETIEQALAREIKEEIGITHFTIERMLPDYELIFKDRHFKFYPFLIQTNEEPFQNEPNLKLQWQPLENMLNTQNQAPSQNVLYSKLKEIGLIK